MINFLIGKIAIVKLTSAKLTQTISGTVGWLASYLKKLANDLSINSSYVISMTIVNDLYWFHV